MFNNYYFYLIFTSFCQKIKECEHWHFCCLLIYRYFFSNQVQPLSWCGVEPFKGHFSKILTKVIHMLYVQSAKKDGLSNGAVLKGKLFLIKHWCFSVEPQYNKGPRPRDWQNLFAIQGCIILSFFYIYILLLLGNRKSFIIPKTSLCRCLLYWGSTVASLLMLWVGLFKAGLR